MTRLRHPQYCLSLNEPDLEDNLSIQIFVLIYGHELLHVLDEIEIMSWLPPRLLNETAPNPTPLAAAGVRGELHQDLPAASNPEKNRDA
jgi:hypothetical protein